MAQKFKPPLVPLRESLEHAMRYISKCDEGVALFWVAGEVRCTRKESPSFENTVKRLGKALIGVYDLGADVRRVREDIAVFYELEVA